MGNNRFFFQRMSLFSVSSLLCTNWLHFTLTAYEFQALQYTQISM